MRCFGVQTRYKLVTYQIQKTITDFLFNSPNPASWRSKHKDYLTGIRILGPSGTTCLPVDYCFTRVHTIQIKLSVLFIISEHHLVEKITTCTDLDIAENTRPLTHFTDSAFILLSILIVSFMLQLNRTCTFFGVCVYKWFRTGDLDIEVAIKLVNIVTCLCLSYSKLLLVFVVFMSCSMLLLVFVVFMSYSKLLLVFVVFMSYSKLLLVFVVFMSYLMLLLVFVVFMS